MPIVNFRGVDQEYYLLTPGQREEYAEAHALGLTGQRPFAGQRADADLRGLSHEAKLALRRQGYKGDLSALPPGPNSGKLAQTTIRNRAGHVIDEYAGDPRAWMNQFSPPVKMEMISIRGPNQSAADWEQTQRRRFAGWQAQNPDKVGDAAIRLIR